MVKWKPIIIGYRWVAHGKTIQSVKTTQFKVWSVWHQNRSRFWGMGITQRSFLGGPLETLDQASAALKLLLREVWGMTNDMVRWIVIYRSHMFSPEYYSLRAARLHIHQWMCENNEQIKTLYETINDASEDIRPPAVFALCQQALVHLPGWPNGCLRWMHQSINQSIRP